MYSWSCQRKCSFCLALVIGLRSHMTQTSQSEGNAGILLQLLGSFFPLKLVNCIKYMLSDVGGHFAIIKRELAWENGKNRGKQSQEMERNIWWHHFNHEGWSWPGNPPITLNSFNTSFNVLFYLLKPLRLWFLSITFYNLYTRYIDVPGNRHSGEITIRYDFFWKNCLWSYKNM